jgi:NAD(P)-dependent dehydrogenase (short-subunit alcohol dehydrogenase family)
MKVLPRRGQEENLNLLEDRTEAKFGPVSVVVNNAGAAATRPALDQDECARDSVIDTNLKGVWQFTQSSARRMIEDKVKSPIVNIASILGLRVAGAMAPYAISKAGVAQMTKALALEWARYGIRVNSLAPGRVRCRLKLAFERDVSFHAIDIDVGPCLQVRDRFFQRLFLDIAEHDLHPRL